MQNLSTIKATHTIKVEDKNHHTWHQGIENYGFWAILIKDKTWLSEFNHAHHHLKHLVLPNYQRAPHLTLSACGLIDEKHFSPKKLQQQIMALRKLDLSPFHIRQAGLDSFESAPYIAIDPNEKLNEIRQVLEQIHRDHPAHEYRPHLTLGFYNHAYPIPDVRQDLMAYSQAKLPSLLVESIAYCSYQTTQIQGKLRVRFEFPLGE